MHSHSSRHALAPIAAFTSAVSGVSRAISAAGTFSAVSTFIAASTRRRRSWRDHFTL